MIKEQCRRLSFGTIPLHKTPLKARLKD